MLGHMLSATCAGIQATQAYSDMVQTHLLSQCPARPAKGEQSAWTTARLKVRRPSWRGVAW